LRGARRKLAKGQLRLDSVFAGNPEGRLGSPRTFRDFVEPVERPIEAIELRPAKLRARRLVIVAVLQKKIAGEFEGFLQRLFSPSAIRSRWPALNLRQTERSILFLQAKCAGDYRSAGNREERTENLVQNEVPK
jgi:hypothetical protein